MRAGAKKRGQWKGSYKSPESQSSPNPSPAERKLGR